MLFFCFFLFFIILCGSGVLAIVREYRDGDWTLLRSISVISSVSKTVLGNTCIVAGYRTNYVHWRAGEFALSDLRDLLIEVSVLEEVV